MYISNGRKEIESMNMYDGLYFDDFLCEPQSDEYGSDYEDWADDFYDSNSGLDFLDETYED